MLGADFLCQGYLPAPVTLHLYISLISLGVMGMQQGAFVSGSVWDPVRERQGWGPGKQTPTRIFYTCKSYLHMLFEYTSVQIWETRDGVREGIQPLDGGCGA